VHPSLHPLPRNLELQVAPRHAAAGAVVVMVAGHLLVMAAAAAARLEAEQDHLPVDGESQGPAQLTARTVVVVAADPPLPHPVESK